MVFYPLTDFVRRMDSVIVELKAKLQERLIKKGMAWQRFFLSRPNLFSCAVWSVPTACHSQSRPRKRSQERSRRASTFSSKRSSSSSVQNALQSGAELKLEILRETSLVQHAASPANSSWRYIFYILYIYIARHILLDLMDFRHYFKFPLQLDQNHNITQYEKFEFS